MSNQSDRIAAAINSELSQVPDSLKRGQWWDIFVRIYKDILTLSARNPDVSDFIIATSGGQSNLTIPGILQIAGFSYLGPVFGTYAAE
ncbi:hypothetical protein ABW19_dt0207114 [Dactylella cylindrospora]|nr:hypothetical protein ABW19_dt0207114 [Dactylella cylindrospora]